jgi:hypothetical protein
VRFRKIYPSLAIALALVACRGVIGIEDLALDKKADGGGTEAGGIDGGGTDATKVDGGGSDAGGCKVSGNCRMCCRDDLTIRPGFGTLEALTADAGCLCAVCGADCTATTCASPPVMGMNMPCNMCADDLFTNPTNFGAPKCQDAKAKCMNDPTCKAALDCMVSCPP